MSDEGRGSELRNALLELLEAVDVDSAPAKQLGAELKFIASTVDLLQLQAARRVAAFDSRQAFIELGEHSTNEWLVAHTHISAAGAASQLTLARQLDTPQP